MPNYNIYSTSLVHHGIKGQKWGVRRFQNKDGSYTDAGKKRASTPFRKLESAGESIKRPSRIRERKISNIEIK